MEKMGICIFCYLLCFSVLGEISDEEMSNKVSPEHEEGLKFSNPVSLWNCLHYICISLVQKQHQNTLQQCTSRQEVIGKT